MEIIKRRIKERERVIAEAKKWLNKIPYKKTAILIGSYVRGGFNQWSDIDLIIIANYKEKPLQRIKKLNPPPAYQVIPLTPEEFQKQVEKEIP